MLYYYEEKILSLNDLYLRGFATVPFSKYTRCSLFQRHPLFEIFLIFLINLT